MNSEKTARYPIAIAIVCAAVFAFCHFYLIDSPPYGHHQWRESDTAAVALNYYQEDFTFLHPRVNQRGAGEGITGMEFPIYCYITAIFYTLFGVHHAIPRLLTLIAALLGLWGFYKLLLSRFQDTAVAAFGVCALALSPLFFFYSFKIMPDITMLALAIWAVYTFDRFISTKQLRYLLISILLLTISAMLKPVSVPLLLPLLYLVWSKKPIEIRRWVAFTLYIAAAVGLPFAWFMFARSLNEQYGSPGFYLGETFWDFPEHWFSAVHFTRHYIQRLPELWVGWGMLVPFIIGVVASIRQKSGGFFWLWFIAGGIALGLTSMIANNHDYYGLIIVPAMAAISGFGLAFLWKKNALMQKAVIGFCIVALLVTAVRIKDRFTLKSNFDAIRRDAELHIQKTDLVIVEDPTTAVRLYQMNRHGWPIRHGLFLDTLQVPLAGGANVLVTEQPLYMYDSAIAPLFDSIPQRIDSLYCYRVRKPVSN